ncbi:MAG: AAA family ATPase, partial [Chloroflexales bacterium]
EIVKAVYLENKTTTPANPPSKEVSPLESAVRPLDSVIDVELYLPGCPPHPAFIFEALSALIEGRAPEVNKRSVCERCKRQMVKTEVGEIKSNSEGIPNAEQCFLSQGYICMGSVTIDRCLAPCPANGVPCTGCAGATMQILTEPNRDIRTEVADRMSRLTAIPSSQILTSMEHASKSHYAYAMASPMIGGKSTFLIKQWIAKLVAERTVDPANILFLSCEGLTDYSDLLETIATWRHGRGPGPQVLFLDEVSFVHEWQRAVLHHVNTGVLDTACVVVTGSNAQALHTTGRGRT